MPAAHPKEFRDDVVAVARRGEAPIAQLARDFGISESCLRNWLHQADVEDAVADGKDRCDGEHLAEGADVILQEGPEPGGGRVDLIIGLIGIDEIFEEAEHGEKP